MVKPCWEYPALMASIAGGHDPGFAALRYLVRRIRHETYPRVRESAELRRRVRAIISALAA